MPTDNPVFEVDTPVHIAGLGLAGADHVLNRYEARQAASVRRKPKPEPNVRRDRIWDRSTLVGWQTAREHDELSRGFVASDRFSLSNLAAPVRGEPVDTRILEAVRPVDWLTALRCAPAEKEGGRTRPLTAQDQAVLEMLISAQRDRHPSMEHLFASVPVAAIMNILGPTGSMLSLLNSLKRLATVECALPGLREPKRRMTARRREAMDEGHAEETWQIDDPASRRGSIEPKPKLVLPSRLPSRRTPQPSAESVPPTAEELLLRDHAPERDVDWWSPPVHVERRFVCVVRWRIDDGVVTFQLARWLRHWLNAFRQVDHRRMPYAAIDLRQMASFSSAYSAPLYRRLVASTFNLATRTARIDDVEVRIPLVDLPEAVGYRVQPVGLPAQLRKKVLGPTDTDFAAMEGRIRISSARIDGYEAVWTVHVPLDIARMRAPSTWRLGDGRVVEIRDDLLEPLRIRECRRFRVSDVEFLKTMNRLKLGRNEILCLCRAWTFAVDEALNAGHAFWGELTIRAPFRRYRGPRLLRVVDDEGAAAAFFRFATEETTKPDLSGPSVLDQLTVNGTEAYASADREARYEWSRWRRSGDPVRVERVLPGPIDREALRRLRTIREEEEWSDRQSHAEDLAYRRDRMAEAKAERLGEDPPEKLGVYGDETQRYFPPKKMKAVPEKAPRTFEAPGMRERLWGWMGSAHIVRDGVRDEVPARTTSLAAHLRTLGYGQPTFGDWLEVLRRDNPCVDVRLEVLRPYAAEVGNRKRD